MTENMPSNDQEIREIITKRGVGTFLSVIAGLLYDLARSAPDRQNFVRGQVKYYVDMIGLPPNQPLSEEDQRCLYYLRDALLAISVFQD